MRHKIEQFLNFEEREVIESVGEMTETYALIDTKTLYRENRASREQSPSKTSFEPVPSLSDGDDSFLFS